MPSEQVNGLLPFTVFCEVEKWGKSYKFADVTLNIREALDKAAQAQEKAQAQLDEVNAAIEKTKWTFLIINSLLIFPLLQRHFVRDRGRSGIVGGTHQ